MPVIINKQNAIYPSGIARKSSFKNLATSNPSFGFEKYENRVAEKLDYICTATPFIRKRFIKINPKTIDINNFPILDNINHVNHLNFNAVCYVGSISSVRGIKENIIATEKCGIRINLAGSYSPSHFKDEFHLLNKYVTNVQTALQKSTSDSDVLLYFPIHDLWSTHKGSHLLQLDVHKYAKWFGQTPFGQTATMLWNNGISFDYISDRQLMSLKIDDKGRLYNDYISVAALIIPATTYISEPTFLYLQSLSNAGATILFVDKFILTS